MRLHGHGRVTRGGFLALCGVLSVVGCYHAEIDLTPFSDEMSRAGAAGGRASSAGAPASGGVGGEPMSGAGGEAGEAGAGAPACDPAPEDRAQSVCRQHVPSMLECDEMAPSGWKGCYAGGCTVCVEVLAGYAHYFDWHPCCEPNTTCGLHAPLRCNARCPAPTEHDKVAPCSTEAPF
jgi:hypothetical protein